VKALGEKCKKIIEYLYFKGYTQKETSEELDIPIGTIKTRNRNCIKDLRTIVLK
jgi:RNA polymerase sigma-70 factor (ECF subfamily)